MLPWITFILWACEFFGLLAVYHVWMFMMNKPLIELKIIIDMDDWLGLIIDKDDFNLDHY